MFPLRSLVLTLIALVAASPVGSAQEKTEHLSDEDRRLFAWFDQLGFEDISRARPVRVRIGYGYQSGENDEHLYDEPRAFLLWRKGAKFRVLLNDLTAATLKRRGRNPHRDTYVGWRPVSLEAETAALLTILRQNPSPASWTDGHAVDADRIDLPTQAFVLARYCAKQGRDDLAARLIHAGGHGSAPGETATGSHAIRLQLAVALDWRATLALADPHLSRHALAALFQHIADKCPKEYQIQDAGALAETLRQMAAEDDAHPKINANQFASLSKADQARELVFQLRNEFDPAPGSWRRPWPFELPHSNGAQKKLIALGHTAVPALLEALSDNRVSRDVGPGWGGCAQACEIRDLASYALDGIAGVRLRECVPGAGQLGPAANQAELQKVAEDWWKTTQEKGDAAWLRARVETGAAGAAQCLDTLTKRYPAESIDLAIATIPKVTDPVRRGEMLARLNCVHTPQADALLLDELAHGPTFGNRVAAAYLLNQRHRPEGMAAMMAAVGSLPEQIQFDLRSFDEALPNPDMFRVPQQPDSTALILTFLLYSDSPAAIHTIQNLLPKCEIQSRFRILFQCAMRQKTAAVFKNAPAAPATTRAIEELFISELRDDTDFEGMGFNGQTLPSFADFAAVQLASFWPAKYRYSLRASPQVRAAQLTAMRTKTAGSSKATPNPK